MTVRYLKVAALFFLVLMLQGCPNNIVIRLYNNSMEDLAIQSYDDEILEWPAGTLLEFKSGGKKSLRVAHDEGGHIIPLLSVSKDTGQSSYKLSFYDLPDEYVRHSGGVIEYSLQLEKNGNLYVVEAGSKFPSTGLSSQPASYPKKPVD